MYLQFLYLPKLNSHTKGAHPSTYLSNEQCPTGKYMEKNVYNNTKHHSTTSR